MKRRQLLWFFLVRFLQTLSTFLFSKLLSLSTLPPLFSFHPLVPPLLFSLLTLLLSLPPPPHSPLPPLSLRSLPFSPLSLRHLLNPFSPLPPSHPPTLRPSAFTPHPVPFCFPSLFHSLLYSLFFILVPPQLPPSLPSLSPNPPFLSPLFLCSPPYLHLFYLSLSTLPLSPLFSLSPSFSVFLLS